MMNFGCVLAEILEADEQSDEQLRKLLNSLMIDPKIQALIPIVSPKNS